MEKGIRNILCRAGLIALLSLALISTAFGHRVPSTSDVVLEVYVLSGASMNDLCGDIDSTSGHAYSDCQACHISGTADLPGEPLSVSAANYVYVATVVAPQESRAVRAVLDPAHALRAPPLA